MNVDEVDDRIIALEAKVLELQERVEPSSEPVYAVKWVAHMPDGSTVEYVKGG